MRYHNFLIGKFSNILNNNNVKLAIKTKNNNKIIIINSNYDYYGIYKLICNCNKFSLEKHRSSKIQFTGHTSEIKFNKTNPNSHFVKNVLESK